MKKKKKCGCMAFNKIFKPSWFKLFLFSVIKLHLPRVDNVVEPNWYHISKMRILGVKKSMRNCSLVSFVKLLGSVTLRFIRCP